MDVIKLDVAWVLICATLVLLMQAGFCCLESGIVRSKNSINVAAKNFADFCISSAIFWLVGYGLMFGTSFKGIVGTHGFGFSSLSDPHVVSFFIFQMMFCGTAATIISGAVAERTKFNGYLMISILVSLLIYPVFGHWAWGGVHGGPKGWLAALGFVDFAGATVVHSVAGWIGLAAAIVIGPRLGRFGDAREKFRSHSLPISTLGVFILWVGWIGFNGGSVLKIDDSVPPIILNTLLAGVFGGVGSMVFTQMRQRRPDVLSFMNGTLAGLVAITASANSVVPMAAAVIGVVAGLLCILASNLLDRMQIDDVVYAFPVHGMAGMWGTLAVAIFGDLDCLGTGLDRWHQFIAQGTGIVVAVGWAFGMGYLLLRGLNRMVALRVSPESEKVGLNISEHDESTDQIDLLRSMEYQKKSGDFSRPVRVDPNSEIGDIADQYNQVLEKLSSAKIDAEKATEAKSDFLAHMSHELRTPLNAIIGFAQMMVNGVFGKMGHSKYQEYCDDIHTSAQHLLSVVNDLLDLSKIEAGQMGRDETVFSIPEVIDEAARLVFASANRAPLATAFQLAEGASMFRGDRRLIFQCVINLISNAKKFSAADSKIEVSATASLADGLVIVVRDQGIGIASEDLSKVLAPFGQVRASIDTSHSGTGLGLPIAKKLCELHGGAMQIDSAQNIGTTITLTFPASRLRA